MILEKGRFIGKEEDKMLVPVIIHSFILRSTNLISTSTKYALGKGSKARGPRPFFLFIAFCGGICDINIPEA